MAEVRARDEALRLRLLLDLHGVSKQEIAAAAGVHPSVVSKWLRGDRRPNAQSRSAIRRLLAERPLFGESA